MRRPATPRSDSRPRPPRARSGFAGRLTGGAFFAALLLAPAPAPAQSPVSGDLEIRAEVHEDLSVFPRSDLEFGTLVAGQGWAEVGLEDERTGEFRIVGQQNRDVEVTLDPPAALENGGEALDYPAPEQSPWQRGRGLPVGARPAGHRLPGGARPAGNLPGHLHGHRGLPVVERRAGARR